MNTVTDKDYEMLIINVKRDKETWRLLEFIEPCPFCGEKHRHGAIGMEFARGNGPRARHCGEPKKGYPLEEVQNKSFSKNDYYIREIFSEVNKEINEFFELE